MIDKLAKARTVAGVAAALLLAGGVAFAATDTGSRPAVSQDEVTSSTSVDQSSTSTSVDDDSTSTTATSEATSTTVGGAGVTSTTEAEHHDNHGACVSAAAHDTPPGPDHGKTVSGVARSDCGKQATGTTETTEANENENEAPEQENEAPEQENEQHGSQSGDHGSSDHGGDHGGSGQD